MHKKIITFFSSTRFLTFLLICIVGIVYGNTMRNGFVWDDITFIEKWDLPRTWNVQAMLAGETPTGHEGVWRPLRTVFMAASYHAWGANPIGYRLQAIVIQMIATILVFYCVRAITTHKTVAFISALFFAVHPVHTESITFTTSSFDTVSSVFFLIAVWAFASGLSRKHAMYTVILWASAVCALLVSEYSMTLPLILTLVYWYMSGKKQYFSLISIYVIFFCYLVIRFGIVSVGVRGYLTGPQVLLMWILSAKALVRYVWLVFFPWTLSVFYYVGPEDAILKTRAMSGLWQYIDGTFITGMVILNIGAIGFLRFFKKTPWISFAIGWFFITMIPFLNIIPTNLGVAEKYLYIPSIAVCLGFGFGIQIAYRFLKKRFGKNPAMIAVGVFVMVLSGVWGIRTIVRNYDWKDSLTLWQQSVKTSPNTSRTWNNLGVAYMNNKQYGLAISAFEEGVRINPGNKNIATNLGQLYVSLGSFDPAIQIYKNILVKFPESIEIMNLLSQAYLGKGEMQFAEETIKKSLLIKKTPDNMSILGLIYFRNQKYREALEQYRSAMDMNVQRADLINNRAITHLAIGETNQAVTLLEEAISRYPVDVELHMNLSNAYATAGDTENAARMASSAESLAASSAEGPISDFVLD